ncbi:Thg1 domain-containing protein [Heracleum sosnowskyi]|uniref:Thg1 domain-containing protein n=1 Tax=Heracleum sosnowskyi TaxID=360622 RepID=A0AAD8H112_9APIA|nr:Thg1 domain-containing protein [Heracleum sosnowskyi]
MANYKYEYVKLDYEVNDQVMFPNLIVVRIHLGNFTIFSQVHEFEQPNDENALNLMNACATVVLKEYPDIVFSYGFRDEYSFVFSKDTNFYQRRARVVYQLLCSVEAARGKAGRKIFVGRKCCCCWCLYSRRWISMVEL